MPDRAYWITWYDLPEAGGEAYFEWLHGSYMPKVLAWPGVLWGAHYQAEKNVVPLGGGKGRVTRHASPDEVPGGTQFILIFGASEPHAFADPGPRAFHDSLGEDDRKMLAMRRGERTTLMIDEARVAGPEADVGGANGEPAPAIQLGSFNADSPEAEDALATWYAQWRLPSMTTLPGIVRTRKLISVAGWAKHACFYEFASLEARNEHFIHYEDGKPDKVAWSQKVVDTLIHATPRAIVAKRLWPPVG